MVSQNVLSWRVPPSREVEKSLRQTQEAAASLPDDATKEEEEARSTLRQKRQIFTGLG